MTFIIINETKNQSNRVKEFLEALTQVPPEDKCSMNIFKSDIRMLAKEGLIIKNPIQPWIEKTLGDTSWVLADGTKPNLTIYPLCPRFPMLP